MSDLLVIIGVIALALTLSEALRRRRHLETRPLWLWMGVWIHSAASGIANGQWLVLNALIFCVALLMLWLDDRDLKREDDELEAELAQEERERAGKALQ